MIIVNYKTNGRCGAGNLLATYHKSFYKLNENNCEARACSVDEKMFLIRPLTIGLDGDILEIPQSEVRTMTMNLVAEMINIDFFEFDLSKEENTEYTRIAITDFCGFPCISENKEFFIEPIDQEKCFEILKSNLTY